MYKVYTLSVLGIPFYVGLTSDCDMRLSTHIACIKASSPIYKLFLEYSQLEIIDEAQCKKEAIKLETYWINQLYACGFKLTNSFQRPGSRKKRVKTLKMVRFSYSELKAIKNKYQKGDTQIFADAFGVSHELLRGALVGKFRIRYEYRDRILSHYHINATPFQ